MNFLLTGILLLSSMAAVTIGELSDIPLDLEEKDILQLLNERSEDTDELVRIMSAGNMKKELGSENVEAQYLESAIKSLANTYFNSPEGRKILMETAKGIMAHAC